MTMSEVEHLTGFEGTDLMNPMARVPDELFANLWVELNTRYPDEALSVDLARSAPLQSLAGLAHGVQYAANVREALELCIENRSVLADRLDLELIENASEVAFTVAHPLDDRDQGEAAVTGLGMFLRVITQVMGVEGGVLRVDLRYVAQGPAESYASFFGAPVHFEGGRNALVLEPSCLERKGRQANLELFAFAGIYFSQLRQQLAGASVKEPIDKLRQAIEYNATHGEFRASSAAARAHMSLRSAQRLASRHGVSLG
ncbi:MAG: AraC family transcriptional regulator ligand-binding domain-containing protein, partial [Myxococcota bacterium]